MSKVDWLEFVQVIFCPQCHRYLGPFARCRDCGWKRERPIPAPGAPLWRFSTGAWITACPAVTASAVLVGSLDNHFYAVARADGAELWSQDLGAHVHSNPAVAGERVVVGADDGGVYALELASGEVAWKHLTGGRVRGGVAVEQGVVYVGSQDAHLYALDARNGRQIWRFAARKVVGCTPAVYQGLVVFGSYDGFVYAVDARRGVEVWRYEAGERVAASPRVAGGLVVACDMGGRVHGIDLHRGQRRWTRDPGAAVRGAPAAAGGVVYVSALDGALHALDAATGAPRRLFVAPDAVASSPAVWEGLALVGCNDGHVYAVDAASGGELWRFRTGGRVCSSPVVSEGVVYIGSDDGALYALPWHLGQWAAAAAHGERRGWKEEAALFHALAGDACADLDERRRHYDAAIAVWRASPDPERAARLKEAALEPPEQVAAAYEHAAQVVRPQDRPQAAALYLRAATFCDEARAEDAARRCRDQASRLARLPRLQVRLVNQPAEAGIAGQLAFDICNYGDAPAQGVRVRLAGQLARRVWFELAPIAAGDVVELVADDVVPLGQALRIDLHFGGQGVPLHLCSHFALDVKPIDADILVGEDAGPIRLRLAKGVPIPRIRVRGSAAFIAVEVEDEEGAPGAELPPFEWPEPLAGLVTEDCELAALVVPEGALEVGPGRTAVVLADGRNVAQVGPGRYSRADFPALRGPLLGAAPRWEAIVVDNRPVRLVFRAGPFVTSDPVRVGVEFGVAARVGAERALKLWLGAGPERERLSASALVERLLPGVANVVEAWLRGRALAELRPGFREREELAVALEAELRRELERSGLAIEGVTAMNFVCPGRERIEAIREAAAWRHLEKEAREGGAESLRR
ncbi:MAG: PQQ-binding-like beta-propeller repeat protein [Anaerolineae bacterium]|nr:PQQ-binding-like beta-propeller repeat protein [Anaerolineae bacterium]